MSSRSSHWSTEQLTEFLAVVSRAPDEEAAVRAAVERAATALDCEIGAFVRDGAVIVSAGEAAGEVSDADLIETAQGLQEIGLPGGLVATAIAGPLEEPHTGWIVFARSAGPFLADEVIVLRGMARILGMTLTTIRALESLRARQRLLEKSASIQSAITLRAPRQEVLDLITKAAGELLGDEVVGLRLIDTDDPGRMHTVASSGVQPDVLREVERGEVGAGVGGKAIAENRLVVVDDYSQLPGALPEFVERGLQAAMASPIHDEGKVIGSLVVASYRPGRTYTQSEQELLVSFAQHASIALLDARSADRLLRQALHDPLTSLANRTLFLDRLEHALARAEREEASLAVLFIDLDGFKSVNDRFGHAAGDAVLVEVGQRLEELMRASDTVARFGGDEFAVLIEDAIEQPAAARVAAAIIERLRAPFVVEGEEISLTASIGIALARRRGEDPLRDADLAMYRAKSAGKDRYEFYAARMRAAMLERLELEGDLKDAIDGTGFILRYQPIVDLTTEAIIGVEALICWEHPERGLLPPSAFIPLAEETGVIFSIGRWVLREACRRAATWPALAGGKPPYISVNLASSQLQQPDLTRQIATILGETGLAANRLVLEITETFLLEDKRANKTLRDLKQLGLRLAVDDFGSGYSSLHHLHRLPLDALKISHTFIDELGENGENLALTQAIVDLGRTFRLDVIAEGIERVEQLTQLRALGCTIGQGYLFSRPQAAEAIDALIRRAPATLVPLPVLEPASTPLAASALRG